VLGPQPTKAEIVAWYERAKKSLKQRREGRHPTLWPIGVADFEALSASVEDHFLRLKKQFNRRLSDGTKKGG